MEKDHGITRKTPTKREEHGTETEVRKWGKTTPRRRKPYETFTRKSERRYPG